MKIASLVLDSWDMTPQVDHPDVHQDYADKILAKEHSQTSQAKEQGHEEDLSLQKLKNMTQAVESYLESLGVHLKFNIDDRSNIVQVEVRDPKTDKLIRKIPADEVLALAESIEQMVGNFLNKVM